MNTIETVAIYRIKGSRKLLRLISGGTSLFQVLEYSTIKAAQSQKQYEVITKEKAAEITGNSYLFEY